MSNDQDQRLQILDNALWRIAHHNDCEYYDDKKAPPSPCDCAPCVAKAAFETAKNWRFHGSHHARVQGDQFPREAKMHAAWMKLANGNQGGADHLLTKGILNDGSVPSARDWYVATSVIQWLATTVGMSILEAAGFKYQQHDQDRTAEDRRRHGRRQPGTHVGCTGQHDDGIADGNLTACSPVSGCGLDGCPYKAKP